MSKSFSFTYVESRNIKHTSLLIPSSMASLLQILHFLSITCLLFCGVATSNQIPKPYVVYMGSSASNNDEHVQTAESAHLQLLSSIIPSEESGRISLIHHYNHAFKGFCAILTETEASILSGQSNIVSVFPDSVLELHTTRSWDFLAAESGVRASPRYNKRVPSDVIIGMVDTGIWPESPSFNDKGIGKIPARWKGVCMEGPDFKKSNCNRKLIGARYYNIPLASNENKASPTKATGSPRDFEGHGTHTASTAAGASVVNASYYGLARGTARGGSPSARIAGYKACSEEGCMSSTILKAIDDAIKDGVDIISISIGMNSLLQSDYLTDPIAIGAFHAEQMGVLVVCSAGNEGPDPYTIVNTAPWIFTVAASNIDRDFKSTVLLGNGKTYQGSAISLSNLTYAKTYPLVFGNDVAGSYVPMYEARNCRPGSLDPKKTAGKIVVCVDDDPTISRRIKKLVVEDAKATGMILISKIQRGVSFDSGTFPFSEVGNVEGLQILKYINSTKNPRATILPTIEVPRSKPAPVVAYFSARGPSPLTENILKPDIMAPGVAILAATIPEREPGNVPIGMKPSQFGIKSGTSMACPHVTGAASLVMSVHPGWTPSMIKSALMTTASLYNNMRKPLTNNSNKSANPHEMGVGELSPLKSLNPGLVFETTTQDYLQFLCHFGYSQKIIRSMSNTNFNCPKNSTEELISNINYPSISIGILSRHHQTAKTIQRTVTNVGLSNTTYIAKVHAPMGLVVKVFPRKLVFFKGVTRLSYKVSFFGKEAPSGYNTGSITWRDGQHSVQTVFTVNVE